MRIRIAAAAVSVAAAGTLAALGTPTLSQASDGRAPVADQGRPQVAQTTAKTATDPCIGGKQKKAFTGGHGYWFESTGSSVVPGTTFQFKGPRSGKDTVFVDLTAYDVYAATGESGRAKVTLDGVPMAPADVDTEYFNESDNYHGLATQYCARVGAGFHKVRVWLDSYSGASVYLYNPMLHVEVAD